MNKSAKQLMIEEMKAQKAFNPLAIYASKLKRRLAQDQYKCSFVYEFKPLEDDGKTLVTLSKDLFLMRNINHIAINERPSLLN